MKYKNCALFCLTRNPVTKYNHTIFTWLYSIKLHNILGCFVILIFSWLIHITTKLPCINTKLTSKTPCFPYVFGLTATVFTLFLTTPINNRHGVTTWRKLTLFSNPLHIKGKGSHWKLLQTNLSVILFPLLWNLVY